MQNHKTQIELIAAEWRQRAKEVVYPLAMRLEGRWLVAVEPIWRERVGDRVLWYYVKGAVDVLLYLEQAGDGRRSVRLEICRLPPRQCKWWRRRLVRHGTTDSLCVKWKGGLRLLS